MRPPFVGFNVGGTVGTEGAEVGGSVGIGLLAFTIMAMAKIRMVDKKPGKLLPFLMMVVSFVTYLSKSSFSGIFRESMIGLLMTASARLGDLG